MKKCLIFFSLFLFVVNTYGQRLITTKEWQSSVSAMAGYNYADGYDLRFEANIRVAVSKIGIYAAFSLANETLLVDKGMPDYKEPVKSYIGEIGTTYSFKMVSYPVITLYPYLGFIHVNEKTELMDRKNKTTGNSFGMGIEFYLTKNFALTAKQLCYVLYSSDYGNFRTVSSAGLTIKF